MPATSPVPSEPMKKSKSSMRSREAGRRFPSSHVLYDQEDLEANPADARDQVNTNTRSRGGEQP